MTWTRIDHDYTTTYTPDWVASRPVDLIVQDAMKLRSDARMLLAAAAHIDRLLVDRLRSAEQLDLLGGVL